VRERPPGVSDADVLAAVRTHWDGDAGDVEHLPVGFDAHHWRARVKGRPALFVTLDATSHEAAYAAAAVLAFRLDFVVAGLPTHDLAYSVPVGGGALSCTPWVWGERPADARETAEATAATLARLHAVTPPPDLPRWEPLVVPDVAATLGEPWDGGPLGERARSAVADHLDDVAAWTDRHHVLAAAAEDRPWVVTHGEPHVRNQLVTPVRTLLIDWESVRLAPAERDLRWLPPDLRPDADPEMVELFDLEWRLDEISQYAALFSGHHTGGPDDETALAGLLEELTRAST
jgi:spectinomycin phosphotransferase